MNRAEWTTTALVAAAGIAVAWIVWRIIGFVDEIRYINWQLSGRLDDGERRYWRRMRCCCVLRLIPFVTRRNVDKVYGRLCHKSRHGHRPAPTGGVWGVLLPSVLGIALCAVCLCGTSWAWFTANTSGDVSAVQAASFEVTLTLGDNATPQTPTDGVYTISLRTDESVTLHIMTDGTATTWYGKLEFGGRAYYTPQIEVGGTYTLTVTAEENGTLTVSPRWGTYSGDTRIEGNTLTVGGTSAAYTAPPGGVSVGDAGATTTTSMVDSATVSTTAPTTGTTATTPAPAVTAPTTVAEPTTDFTTTSEPAQTAPTTTATPDSPDRAESNSDESDDDESDSDESNGRETDTPAEPTSAAPATPAA